jgi:hypothetical protein
VAGNEALARATRAKNDEFYTQLRDQVTESAGGGDTAPQTSQADSASSSPLTMIRNIRGTIFVAGYR